MVTVNKAGRPSLVRWGRRFADHLKDRRSRRPAAWNEPAPATGLSVIDPAADRRTQRDLGRRPQAAFIAQLLAERLDMPQSRVNRRAGADEADASYQAADPAARGTGRGAIVRRDI